jgi:hypothetical protein
MTGQRVMSVPDTELRDSVTAHANELAQAISHRDAAGAARLVQPGDYVVYVSDGFPIRGRDYRTVLGRFYGGMKTIAFSWDSSEVRAIDSHTGVFTGWARIVMADTTGRHSVDRSIFTLVYARRASAWEMVIAHKTTLR